MVILPREAVCVGIIGSFYPFVRQHHARNSKTLHERKNMNVEITGTSVVGVAIGLIGTYGMINKAAGPRERAFMLKSAAIGWLIIGACLVGTQLLGRTSAAWLSLVYVIGLIAVMRFVVGKQRQIRSEESKGPARI